MQKIKIQKINNNYCTRRWIFYERTIISFICFVLSQRLLIRKTVIENPVKIFWVPVLRLYMATNVKLVLIYLKVFRMKQFERKRQNILYPSEFLIFERKIFVWWNVSKCCIGFRIPDFILLSCFCLMLTNLRLAKKKEYYLSIIKETFNCWYTFCVALKGYCVILYYDFK